MSVLYGNDSADFEVADHSDPQTGGVEWTVQTIGAPLYMDNRGVRRFDVTDKFGNFVSEYNDFGYPAVDQHCSEKKRI